MNNQDTTSIDEQIREQILKAFSYHANVAILETTDGHYQYREVDEASDWFYRNEKAFADKMVALISDQVAKALMDAELILSAIAHQSRDNECIASNASLVACSGKVKIVKNPPGIDGILIQEATLNGVKK